MRFIENILHTLIQEELKANSSDVEINCVFLDFLERNRYAYFLRIKKCEYSLIIIEVIFQMA